MTRHSFWRRWWFVGILGLAGWSGAIPASAVLVSIQDAAAILGSNAEIAVPVYLNPGSGEMVSAVQLEVTYDPTQLTPGAPRLGAAGILAGKELQTDMAAGKIRILLFGINQTAMPQGAAVWLTFRLAPTASSGQTALTLNQLIACSPSASLLTSTPANGVVTLSAGAWAGDLSRVKAYPNPFRPASGQTRIRFAPLTANAEISIHQLTGELLAKIQTQTGGSADWDGRNASGQEIASGVYLYCVTNPKGEKHMGKLVILR